MLWSCDFLQTVQWSVTYLRLFLSRSLLFSLPVCSCTVLHEKITFITNTNIHCEIYSSFSPCWICTVLCYQSHWKSFWLWLYAYILHAFRYLLRVLHHNCLWCMCAHGSNIYQFTIYECSWSLSTKQHLRQASSMKTCKGHW